MSVPPFKNCAFPETCVCVKDDSSGCGWAWTLAALEKITCKDAPRVKREACPSQAIH